MKLSRARQGFVLVATPLLILATQVQSCSAGSGGQQQATGGSVSGGSGGSGGSSGIGGVPGTGAVPGSGGATGGIPGLDASFTPPNPAEKRVSIVQSAVPTAAAIDQNEVTRLVTEAVNLAGGLQDIVHDGQSVVVKPNLVAGHDFSGANWTGLPLAQTVNGVTTDYRVTAAVVALVRQLNPSGTVYVMEGSAYPTAPIMAALGYDAAHIPGVTEFVALESDTSIGGITDPASTLGLTMYYNTRYLAADVIISVATLKTHYNAVVTGGIKNLGIGATPASWYGNPASTANPVTRQGGPNSIDHTTVFLHHWIADYYAGKPASFVVIDGLQGVQHGPNPSTALIGATTLAANQMNMRLIMAGRDGVAVDTVESLVMGWDPMSVTYLVDLHNRGVGTMETANIRVVGSRVDQVRRTFAGILTEQAYGGAQVTDTTPPPVTMLAGQVAGRVLSVSIQSNPDLRKVEVYLSGVLVEPPVASNFETITLDVSGFAPGVYSLDMLGYDYSLNATLVSVPAAVTLQ
jgi:uncharacterized protein (DUF362 family)